MNLELLNTEAFKFRKSLNQSFDLPTFIDKSSSTQYGELREWYLWEKPSDNSIAPSTSINHTDNFRMKYAINYFNESPRDIFGNVVESSNTPDYLKKYSKLRFI